MGSTKEIQTRMKSIQDTMKITNAMYMISSSKMQKAKRILSDTEPYYYNMQAAISRILRHMPEVSNQYFDSREEIPKEERKIGSVVITGDKGLAGAYNHNVEKAEEEISLIIQKFIDNCEQTLSFLLLKIRCRLSMLHRQHQMKEKAVYQVI